MDEDHGQLWRYVGRKAKAMEEFAPEGWAPVVEVYLATQQAPIVVNRVETQKGFAYALLHSLPDSFREKDPTATTDRFIFARRDLVTHVEVRYVRAEPGDVGFSHREGGTLSDDSE